jgi:hypothetical protein
MRARTVRLWALDQSLAVQVPVQAQNGRRASLSWPSQA